MLWDPGVFFAEAPAIEEFHHDHFDPADFVARFIEAEEPAPVVLRSVVSGVGGEGVGLCNGRDM